MCKILLMCSAGMSTSMVVKKMRKAAKKREINVEIDAVGLEKFTDKLSEFDVFLLGPQVRFKKDDFAKKAEEYGKKLAVIDPVDYGGLKGDKILGFALDLID
ncbi:PTS sugar transporter subunit IIB [Halanaerocella petrolearia]